MVTQTEPTKTHEKTAKEGGFESKLREGRQRFLAHVIEHGLGHGRRTPEDFIRHFPPAAIMHGLREQPQLRANILVIATGVRSKIALKKPAESCGIDLQISIDEGETDAETVVQLFDPDDRVRYLDERALWSYVTDGSFWQVDAAKDRPRHAVAAEHIAFMISRGLKDGLLTHRDVIEGITVAKLAEHLPRTELEKVISAALKAGSANKPYVETNLLSAAPPNMLTQHVPLPWIWEQVIAPRIAETHAFVAKKEKPSITAEPAAKAEPLPQSEPHPAEDSQEMMIEGVGESTSIDVAPAAPSGDLDLEVEDVLGGLDVSVAPINSPAAKAPAPAPAPLPRPPRRGGGI